MKGKLAFWPVVLCVVLFSLTTSRSVYGQAETGAIDGTVTDSTGAVIPSAKVVVRSVATGAERTASTNERAITTYPTFCLVCTGSSPKRRIWPSLREG